MNLIWILAVLGCSLQLYNVLTTYLEYNTRINCKLGYKTYDYLFGITLSVAKEEFTIGNTSIWSKVDNNLYENFMDSTKQFLNQCIIHGVNVKQNINCNLVTNVTIRISTGRVYFTLFERPVEKVQLEKYRYYTYLTKTFLVAIIVNTSYLANNRICVSLHPPNLMTANREFCEEIQIQDSRLNQMYYTKTHYSYLKEPYKTDCLDYRDIGYQSRDHCLDKCRILSTLKMCNALPTHVPVLMQEAAQLGKDRLESNHKCQNEKQVIKSCRQRCRRLQCEEDSYTIQRMGLNNRKFAGLSVLIIGVPNDYPNIQYVHQPEMSVMDVVVYIAGTLAFWFGLSAAGMSDHLIDWFRSPEFRSIARKVDQQRQRRLFVKRTGHGAGQSEVIFKVIKMIFYALCGICCCYQGAAILESYYLHETETEIVAGFLPLVYLPAFTIIHTMASIVNETKFCGPNQERCSNETFLDTFYAVLQNQSISIKQLSGLFYTADEMYGNCTLYQIGDIDKQPCSNIDNIHTFYTDQLVLHTFFWRPHSLKYDKSYSFDNLGDVSLIDIECKMETKSEAYINVHPSDQYPRVLSSKLKILDTMRGAWTFTKFSLHLLEKPFTTDCEPYQKTYDSNRQNLIDSCLIELTEKHCNATPPMTTIHELKDLSRTFANDPCYMDNEIMRICEQKYHKLDCHSDFYQLNQYTSSAEYDIKTLNIIRSWTEVHDEYRFRPKVKNIDVFIYLAGSFSLWFGISVLAGLTAIEQWLKKYFGRHFKCCNHSLTIACHLTTWICLVLQILNIVQLYLEYQTLMDILRRTPTSDFYPAISFVFSLYDVLNFKGINIQPHDIIHNDSITNSKLLSMVLDPVKSCEFSELSKEKQPRKTVTLSDDKYLVTFGGYEDMGTNGNIEPDIDFNSPKLDIFGAKVKLRKANTSFEIVFHAPWYLPTMPTNRGLTIDYEAGTSVSVMYTKTTMKTLPSPYRSKCKNHSENTVGCNVNNDVCFCRCVWQKTIEECGGTPPVFVLSEYQSMKLPRIPPEHPCFKGKNIFLRCLQESQYEDCVKTSYEVIPSDFQALSKSEDTGDGGHQVVKLKKPTNVFFSWFTLRPAFTEMSLIVYIINSVNFWFGLQFLALSKLDPFGWI